MKIFSHWFERAIGDTLGAVVWSNKADSCLLRIDAARSAQFRIGVTDAAEIFARAPDFN
jgi:hypothetical protein